MFYFRHTAALCLAARQVGAYFASASAQLDRLEQATLAKAFRGELLGAALAQEVMSEKQSGPHNKTERRSAIIQPAA